MIVAIHTLPLLTIRPLEDGNKYSIVEIGQSNPPSNSK